jgi:DNA-binding MarR family transcriptional regulator
MKDLTERERLARLADTCAGINLRRAARAITNHYDHIFTQACGLRATQIPPLVALYLGGPQTIQQIAGRLELDRTTLSRNLKLLEETGLVTIAPGEDQRTRLVSLTPKGQEVLLKALPVWEAAQSQVVESLGEDRFQTLLAQLSEVAELSHEA